jgi:hypothetical protein
MTRYVIVPIVEGDGEVAAVPVLLQRWLSFRRYHNVEVHVDGPVRASGKGSLTVPHDGKKELGVEHYLKHALFRQPDAVLILLDADEDCAMTLGSRLHERALRMVPRDYPIGVVVATREYEAWFVAGFASARFRAELANRGYTLQRQGLPRGTEVEDIADCKKYFAKLIGLKKYEEKVHQFRFTGILPFTRAVTRRSRSFRKLLKELDALLVEARKRRQRSS